MLDLAGKASMDAVVLEQVGVDRGVAEPVTHLQLFAVVAGIQGAKNVSADATEAVDGQADSHNGRLFLLLW